MYIKCNNNKIKPLHRYTNSKKYLYLFNIDKIVLKIFIQLLFLFYALAEGTSRNMKLVVIVVSSQLWNPTLQSHTPRSIGSDYREKKHSVIYC